jgi:hypothetical protein
VPFGKLMNERTGDHTTNAALFAMGPGIGQNRVMPEADILDIGPTILSLLDVAPPNRFDGKAIDWVKTRHRAKAQATTR